MASNVRYILDYRGTFYYGGRALSALRQLADAGYIATSQMSGEKKWQWAIRIAKQVRNVKLTVLREKRKTRPCKSAYIETLRAVGFRRPVPERPLFQASARARTRPQPLPRTAAGVGFGGLDALLTRES